MCFACFHSQYFLEMPVEGCSVKFNDFLILSWMAFTFRIPLASYDDIIVICVVTTLSLNLCGPIVERFAGRLLYRQFARWEECQIHTLW
jgi:hypothetical protein